MAGNEVRILVNATDKASKVFSDVSKASKLMGVAVATAVLGIGVASVKMASTFDKGMREVNTLLQLPEAGFKTLKEDLLDFSQEMGITANEVVPALYQAISAGVPRDNVFQFLEIAGKTAIGGVTSLEVAVGGLTSVTNAYGRDSLSASKAADIMFTAMRLGTTTIGELSASLFNVVPIAAATGVEFDQVAAAMTALTLQGVPTTVAATQLRGAIQALSAPTKTQRKLMNELGLDFSATRLAQIGLSEAFREAIEATDGDMSVLRELIGSVEGLQAVLALGGKQAETFTEILEEMGEAGGAVEAAFEQMEETTARKFEEMKTNIDLLMIKLGDRLLPKVNTALDEINRSLEEDAEEWEKWGRRAEKSMDGVFTALKLFARGFDFQHGGGNVDLANRINEFLGFGGGGGGSDAVPNPERDLLQLRAAQTALNAKRAFAALVLTMESASMTAEELAAATEIVADAQEAAADIAERVADAMRDTVERQTSEIVEAFIRGGDAAVAVVREEQSALDAAWAAIVGDLGQFGAAVPAEFRSMFDDVQAEMKSAANRAVEEERRKQDRIFEEQKRATDAILEEQRRATERLRAGAVGLFAAAVNGQGPDTGQITGFIQSSGFQNPDAVTALLNLLGSGASEGVLLDILRTLVGGLTVTVDNIDEIESPADAAARGVTP